MTNKLIPTLIVLLLSWFALSASGADLNQVKRDGLVGERADGYLGLVDDSAASDVRALVAEINEKRKAEYNRIARANELTLQQVQVLAGKKAIERTKSGQWVLRNGGWVRK